MKPQRYLHADAAGYLTPTARMTPAELGLSLSADVLRLPYSPAVRLVLAEVVSLHAATGRCCCSDTHLAARLGIHKDTAGVAVKELRAAGLLVGDTDKAAGNVRVLVPVPAAIAAKAATNPYPEIPGSPPTRKKPEGYPEFPGSPTRKKPEPLPGNSGPNTTGNSTDNFQEVSTTTTPFGRGGAAPVVGRVADEPAGEGWAEAEVVASEPDRPTEPPKKKVAAKKKPPRPARAARPEVPFAESELAGVEAFCAAFAGTDWELADLPFYHAQVANWRKDGEPPRRKDWKATATKFLLNDQHDNRLKLAPGTQRYDPARPGDAVGNGKGATGYRSSRANR